MVRDREADTTHRDQPPSSGYADIPATAGYVCRLYTIE